MKKHNPSEVNNHDTRPQINKVVLVGHCGFDQASLARAVASALPGLAVESAYDTDGLDRLAGPDALLLVNRVLDGRFTTGSGIDLIVDLANQDPAPRVMLISNYADAQAQAVQAGALPGFGKSEMGTADTEAKLRAATDMDTTVS